MVNELVIKKGGHHGFVAEHKENCVCVLDHFNIEIMKMYLEIRYGNGVTIIEDY